MTTIEEARSISFQFLHGPHTAHQNLLAYWLGVEPGLASPPLAEQRCKELNLGVWLDALGWHKERLEAEYRPHDERIWEALGDRCPELACEPGAGCQHCRFYRCFVCHEVRGWDNGGTDSICCDECYAKDADECA